MIAMLFLPMLLGLPPADPLGVWEVKTFLHKDAVDVVDVEGAVEKDFGLVQYKDSWIHDGTIVIERLRRTDRCFAVSWYRAGHVQHVTTIIAADDGTYHGKLPKLPTGTGHFAWELKWDNSNRGFTFRLRNPGGSQTWRMRQIAKIPH